MPQSTGKDASPAALDALIASEFASGGLIYLNHAAVSRWPRRTADAVKRFADENLRDGASRYSGWLAIESELRVRAARLLDSRPGDIAFTKSTSEALSFIAHGFPWKDGDRVVFPAEEFPSNRIVWEALAPRITASPVPLAGARDPEQRLIDALHAPTRLLAVSSVQYANGLRLDLERLGSACRRAGVAFCVDAIQGLGYLPHSVEDCAIDFLMADGHKWLLGPEGLALFYCRDTWRERLTLHEFGWHMVEHAGDFDRSAWEPARSAQRFECGSPNMLGIHALNASLSLIEEVGVARVGGRLLDRSAWLIESLLGLSAVRLLTDAEGRRRSGIVTFTPRNGGEPARDQLFERLTKEDVFCARRGGGIRLSPHFYTPMVDLEKTIDIIRSNG
ncbi:MAG: aminotransferase class V-fold PLP-dependent enzyme [Acidiferrobacteraceae bacterium]